MKPIKLLIGLVLACVGMSVQAQQYGVLTTIISSNVYSIADTAATNLSAVANNVTATKHDEFVLSFKMVHTAGYATGNVDVVWAKAASTSLFPSLTNGPTGLSGNKGWFAIPVTGGGPTTRWATNMPMDSFGYFQIQYLTNRTGLGITNLVIEAYAKPKTSG